MRDVRGADLGTFSKRWEVSMLAGAFSPPHSHEISFSEANLCSMKIKDFPRETCHRFPECKIKDFRYSYYVIMLYKNCIH